MAEPYVGLMVVGYAGYCFCRSNLAVTLVDISEELTRRGITSLECCIVRWPSVCWAQLTFQEGRGRS